MIADDYSSHPNLVYSWALEQAGKGQDVFIAEVQYPHPFSPIYYQAFKGERPIKQSNMSSLIVEMAIPAFDMFGSLTTREVHIINKVMRRIDDSNSWPICGQFNATERAIRRLRKVMWSFDSPYSYWKSLENEISNIVNKEV